MKATTIYLPKMSNLIFTLFLTVVLLQPACLTVSVPPDRGIAVKTFEGIQGIPNSHFPLPNVPNAGDLLLILGPSPGTEESFRGITDSTAISKYPNVRTNARWEVSAGPTVAPPCAQGFDRQDVPSAGAIFEFICTVLRRP